MAIAQRTATAANTGAAAATSLAVTKPTGTSAGDLLIIVLSVNNGSSCTITTLSGWTLLNRTNSTTVLGQAIYYRIADGTEGASFTWSFTSEFASIVCNAYTGVDNSNPFASLAALPKTTASTSGTFGPVTPQAENPYPVLFLTSRNTTGTTTVSTASSGYTKNGDTCTTATTFIQAALEDQHATIGFPLATFTPASTTFSRSVTDIDTVVLLRADISGATAITVDAALFVAQNTNSGVVATPSFSTGYANEVIIVVADAENLGDTLTIANTGGLTFTLKITPQASGDGVQYVWTAVASAPLTGITITVTDTTTAFSDMRLYVWTFRNVNTTTPIGATNKTSTAGGSAPTLSLTTTAANSWVWGAVYDGTNNGTITAGTAQTVLASNKDVNDVESSWLQRQNAATVSSGSSVTINNTAPTADPVIMIVFEIMLGGGTPHTMSLSATYSATGSLSRATARPLNGTYKATGSIISRAITRTLAGTYSTTGLLTRFINKTPFSGTYSTSGVLTAIEQIFMSLSGTYSTSGQLVSRAISRTLSGTYKASGLLTSRALTRLLTATYKGTGTLTKLTSVLAFAGTYVASGTLSSIVSVAVTLTGTYKASGVIISRGITRTVTGTYKTSGVLTRFTTRTLSGTYSAAGTVKKALARLLPGGTYSTSGTLSKQTHKSLSAQYHASGTLTKQTRRLLTGSYHASGTITKSIAKGVFNGIYQASGVLSITKAISMIFTATYKAAGFLTSTLHVIVEFLQPLVIAINIPSPIQLLFKVYDALMLAISRPDPLLMSVTTGPPLELPVIVPAGLVSISQIPAPIVLTLVVPDPITFTFTE